MYSEQVLQNSIKKARELAGLTQKEVETELSLRPLTMRDYEVGRLKLPVLVAVQLAELYKVSLEQLVGRQELPQENIPSRGLVNFTSIFEGNGFSIMYLDPIIRAYLEDHHDYYFDNTLFDTLTENLNQSNKKKLVVEIGKMLMALAASDGKISDQEIEAIKYILKTFNMGRYYKDIKTCTEQPYALDQLPPYLQSIEVRHFIIWLMFLFAKSDDTISKDEVEFIKRRAEEMKINRSNYLAIKAKFLKEN